MTTYFSIRSARPADAASLAGLLYRLEFFSSLEGASVAETESIVARALQAANGDDAQTVLVAVDSAGAILGYCLMAWIPCLYLTGPEGYLSELFVDADARGRGVGGALLDAVTEEARRRGSPKLQLINFRHRESYARSFYAKHGWEERPLAANFALYLD